MTNEYLSTIALELGFLRERFGNSVGLDEIEKAAGELAAAANFYRALITDTEQEAAEYERANNQGMGD